MKNNNNIIQSLWIGNELSRMEIMCIHSYLFHGHQFDLYVYDEISNIPKGTTIKDANLIIPKNEIVIDHFGGYVNFSNKFRYTLLYKKGGWWVDMDTVCLKSFDFDSDYVFSSESCDSRFRCIVNTTFIKSQPEEKFLSDCLDFMDKRGYQNLHWGELGVNLLSRMIFRNNMDKHIKPPATFCPISPYQIDIFFNGSDSITDESYALHWWNELWRKNNIDKSASFPENSLFQKLKEKYLIENR